jgi:hypothetical protein
MTIDTQFRYLSFGDFRLDCRSGELRKSKRELRLQPQPPKLSCWRPAGGRSSPARRSRRRSGARTPSSTSSTASISPSNRSGTRSATTRRSLATSRPFPGWAIGSSRARKSSRATSDPRTPFLRNVPASQAGAGGLRTRLRLRPWLRLSRPGPRQPRFTSIDSALRPARSRERSL